jgi:5-methylthioadenosine/S-adenosylhomocysteine deaminase
MPGLVDAHDHSPRPSRAGLIETPLELSLLQLRRRRLPALSEQEQREHARWFALSLLRTGVTTVVDCFSPDPTRADLGLVPSAEAYLESGIRAAICVRCSDRRNLAYEDDADFYRRLPSDLVAASEAKTKPFAADQFFGVCEEIARDFDGRHDRLRIGYGPTGEQWCSDDLLERIRDTAGARSAPVQIHLLESPLQAQAARRASGQSAVGRLAGLGFIGPTVSFAHGIWLSSAELDTIARARSVIVHNPGSNLRYGNGIAPVQAMLSKGCLVGIGLDGVGFEPLPDMFREVRLAALLQRRSTLTAYAVTPAMVLAAATTGGAAAAGMRVSSGVLESGRAADLVLLDRHRILDDPYRPIDDEPYVLITDRADRTAVDRVIVAGRTVFQSGDESDREFASASTRVRDDIARYLPLLDAADEEFRSLRPYAEESLREAHRSSSMQNVRSQLD